MTEIAPDAEPELKAIQKRIDAERKAFAQPAKQIRLPVDQKPVEPKLEPQPEPKPNQIPVPQQKPDEPGATEPQA